MLGLLDRRLPRRRARSGVASVGLLALGCGADSPGGVASGAPAAALELERTSSPALELTRVSGVEMDSRGRVFVVDDGRDGVVALSPDLEFLRTVGRAGEGPGEFRDRRMRILPGDSLAIYDRELGRTTVFDPDDFAPVRSAPAPTFAAGPPDLLWSMGRDRDRYLAVVRSLSSFWDVPGAADRDLVFAAPLDSVPDDPALAVPAAEMLVSRSSGALSVGRHPYGAESLIRPLGPDRFVYARTSEARFWIFDLEGDTVAEGVHPWPRPHVSRRELEVELGRWSPPLDAVLRRGAPYRWPALVAMVVASDAEDPRLWLGLRAPADSAKWAWHAFDAAGSHAVATALPAGRLLRAVRGDVAVATSTNLLGVPSIHRYRLKLSP